MSINLFVGFIFAFPVMMITGHLLSWHHRKAYCYWNTACVALWLVMAGYMWLTLPSVQNITVGNWPAPFAINVRFDHLSTLMLAVFAGVALCIDLFSLTDQQLDGHRSAYYAGFWLLLLGVAGAICTRDLFNLYVWLEVMLVSALILLGCSHKLASKAMMHYAIINIAGTLLMLLAVALLYGITGQLSYQGIGHYIAAHHQYSMLLPVMALLLFALALKGGIFPLYFWLPVAYPQPSNTTTQLLGALMTKSVMVVLLYLTWQWSLLSFHYIGPILMVAAWLTMSCGVLGAANQFTVRRILSFHILSQLGYILLAIIIPSHFAIVAAVYFIIHNIAVKTALLMTGGIIEQTYQSDDLKQLGGLYQQHKWLAVAFFISAISLAGFPPLSGFWAKYLVIRAALSAHFYVSTAIAIAVSLFTLYSMMKIWRLLYCEAAQHMPPANPIQTRTKVLWVGAVLPLLCTTIVMGIWPDLLLNPLQHITTASLGL